MTAFPIRKTLTAALASLAVFAVGFGPATQAAPGSAKVGAKAPDFTLTDLEGNEHSLSDFTGDDKVVVLEWFNAGCPFVKRHYREDTMTMNKLADKYRDDGVVWLRINSGAPGKQGTGLEFNKQVKADWKIADPILLDESGVVGKAYNAKNTPAMAVIGKDGTLMYWGAIDDDARGRKDNPTNYVDQALTQVLAGETVTTATTKPYGCGVKY